MAAASAALILLGAPALRAAGQPSGGSGVVETVAGPGFCTSNAAEDPESAQVRSIAVEPGGRLFFSTGSLSGPAGQIGKVDEEGHASLLAFPWGPSRRSGSLPASSIVADGTGGVLVALADRIMKVDSEGSVSTVAGGRTGAGLGDGGPAEQAGFTGLEALASGSAGELYAADALAPGAGTFRIRVINRGAAPLRLLAGTPRALQVAPGGIASIPGSGPVQDRGGAMVFEGTTPSLAVAGSLLYAAGFSRHSGWVRVANLGSAPATAQGVSVGAGQPALVAGGNGAAAGLGDAGPAVAASLGRIPGIAAGGGSLYLADEDHERVRRVDASGRIDTVAGGGEGEEAGFNGNGRPAAGALLDHPTDVKLGPLGVYIADEMNGQVRVVDGSGLIRAMPGSGLGRAWVCRGRKGGGGKGVQERPLPGGPSGLAIDSLGRAVFALADGDEVERVDGEGMVSSIAGRLKRPTALAAGSRGALFVLEEAGTRVRLINLSGSSIRAAGVEVARGKSAVVAGTGVAGSGGDGGRATSARLGGLGEPELANAVAVGELAKLGSARTLSQSLSDGPPGALASDGTTLFIADPANHEVRAVDAAGTITAFAGQGALDSRQACCQSPSGLALDPQGNLYVSDRSSSKVWVINRGAGSRSILGQVAGAGGAAVVGGTGTQGVAGDGGPAVDAQLFLPMGMVVDSQGDLYIAEGDGDVRRVEPSGLIGTAAGNGQGGFNGDGLNPLLTNFSFPTALALDGCGNLLIADYGNDRVRRVRKEGSCIEASGVAGVGRAPSGHSRWVPFLGLVALGALGGLALGLRFGGRERRH